MSDTEENTRSASTDGSSAGEKLDLAQPLDADAAQLPAGGADAASTGMPTESVSDDARDRLDGLPQDVPPVRMGQSSAEQAPAEVRGDTSNSGGSHRIDPATHIPPPVTPVSGRGSTGGNGG